MEWLDRYSHRPLPIKERSLVANFNSLTINEEDNIEIEPPAIKNEQHNKLESFDEFSFSSSLQRQFK